MIVNGQLNQSQLKELKKAVNSLEMPPKKRQRLLWRIAKYGVIQAAKRNVRNQRSPDGESWPARKTPWRKKMLRNMPKLLHIREMPEISAVRLYLQGGHYRNGNSPVPAGLVGGAQQNGMRTRRNRKTASEDNKAKTVDLTRKATIKQAKKLRDLGYQVKKGKRLRKPTIKEITENMLFIKAGEKIRKLSGKAAKSSWTIDVPARAFLGLNDDEFNKALVRQLQAINYGWEVKAQDMN
ncbi:hypothetical protein [Xenorhabdus griffiniae]|uniref:Phage protein n=1 Tax=Xenorhabdus griffiniae TaxID=351672 RepID=A0ABY9XL45_9GAMM|nr:hypothetical protein [Xenorhabdus griffiniae]MBD1229317.1 hypothetical protein [Xenorhabdus griffiniae]MBE8588456.1 hypothetical protein [Xenorhabdus griffiniae]WMV73590.1 hypothetical protein QL128_06100 [Xenorhabdus griffiniae]WNH03270.1 hypothetical protein QL112_006105 [Xenorhabdus griffiniae]